MEITETDVIMFALFSICMGFFTREALKRINKEILYRVIFLIYGGLIGIVANFEPQLMEYVQKLYKINIHYYVDVFVPILVLKTALYIDVHMFMQSFWQICLLGIPGFIISVILISTVIGFLLQYDPSNALIFGVICSTTYPFDLIQMLLSDNKLQYSYSRLKHLMVLLEGMYIKQGTLVGFYCWVLLHNYLVS